MRGDLDISYTRVASLPTDLKVGGDLNLIRTRVASLPTDLQVGGTIIGLDRKYWARVPEHLKGNLR